MCFSVPVMGTCVAHLKGSCLSLCFQDVTLQFLWGAPWSGNWAAAACAAQTALFCELHYILLQQQGGRQQTKFIDKMETIYG